MHNVWLKIKKSLRTDPFILIIKSLCEIVEKPGNFGNASIWATGTQLLESAGFDERIIKMFSSHEGNDLFTNSGSSQESDFNVQMESSH